MENTATNPHEAGSPGRRLTRMQTGILIAAAVPIAVGGGLGGWGTFTNILTEFPRDATAIGVVAAGEGGTLTLAIVMVLVTLLGQSSPGWVRAGLWVLPLIASATGAAVADTLEEAVVYAVTPLAMIAAAEGLGLIARRVVVYCTGVDMEARRRNATTVQKMAVLRALAANHPKKGARRRAELASWRLARKVGIGDDDLGAGLVTVQRERLTSGADTALAAMFTPARAAVTPAVPALPVSGTPALAPGTGHGGSGTASVPDGGDRHAQGRDRRSAVTAPPVPVTAPLVPGTGDVTQVSAGPGDGPAHTGGTGTVPARDGVTATGTPSGTQSVPDTDTGTVPAVPDTGAVTDAAVPDAEVVVPVVSSGTAVTLKEIAAVVGVPVPEQGERLSDAQLMVVVRHLRYRVDPPLSYRQAMAAFRRAGFVGGEERIRRTWAELMSQEEDAPSDTAGTPGETPADEETVGEEDEEEAGPRP
ncbi:hypothetical protein ABT354_36075 [Streptomyces sp. NPDC000594]|uniref:hypothetical protein n=1 Tax=Streptomyces sp. NPDC000594 TaxID=3154261 RepID=UPI00331B9552